MRKHQAFYLALPTVLALLVLFIAPMVYILVGTLRTDGLQYYQKFLTDSFYLNILWTTVKISLQTTLICLLLGYPAAYFLARTKSRIKNLLIIMTVFPFLVSAVVRSYGWMVILGKNGLLGGTKFRMMSTMVFQEVNVNFNWGFASAISYILLFVILVILLVSNFAADRYTRRLGGGKNA